MTTPIPPITAQQAANAYLTRGWMPIPVPHRSKNPGYTGWELTRLTAEDIPARFDGQPQNIGTLLGEPSGWLIDIDLDHPRCVELADQFLPPTPAVFGRPGKPRSHRIYIVTGPVVTKKHKSRSAGMLAELRSTGMQTVFPPSTHESGEPITWETDGAEPATVDPAELLAAVERLANAVRIELGERAAPKPAKPASKGGDGGHRGDREGRVKLYAAQALRLELNAVCSTTPGSRNDTLNKAAFSLGTLIGGGYLDRQHVEDSLRQAALTVGLEAEEVDKTIHSGIEAGMKEPRQIPARTRCSRPPAAGQAGHQRSEYILTPGPHKDDQDRYTEQSTATFADQILTDLPAEAIYRKDSISGEILGIPGNRRWAPLTADRMRLVVDSNVRLGKWFTNRNDEQVLVFQACSKDAAGLVVAHSERAPNVRELVMMVSYPVYGPGFVRLPPGWHEGLFYDEPNALRNLVPETDSSVIRNVLHDLVVDFPFKAEADRQNFFGLMLTPVVAPALDGNRPMHLVNAPLERTGKSKLVNEVFGGVILGRDTPSMQISEREEEREKRILAMLLQDETLMHLDNLPTFIDSQSLASLLTAQIFAGRVLGLSRTVRLSNNLTIVGTGNNVYGSGEIAKRIVPILIEPKDAKPEARTDFQHPDIRDYVRQRRRCIFECLLGLVENWLAAGKPRHAHRLGGFENWSEIVGGILQVSGLDAWRSNEDEWHRKANPRGVELEEFVQLWHDAHGTVEVTPKELLSIAEEHELFAFVFSKNTPQARGATFGKLLAHHANAPIGQWFIRQRVARQTFYHLEVIP